MRLLTAALLLSCVLPAGVIAQRRPLPVGPGERVRVWTAGDPERREGIVVAVDSDALLLGGVSTPNPGVPPESAVPPFDTISIAAIERMHVFRHLGLDQRVRNALGYGMLLGIAGTLVGGAIGNAALEDSLEDPGIDALIGGGVGLLIGITTGTAIGFFNDQRWEGVDLTPDERDRFDFPLR